MALVSFLTGQDIKEQGVYTFTFLLMELAITFLSQGLRSGGMDPQELCHSHWVDSPPQSLSLQRSRAELGFYSPSISQEEPTSSNRQCEGPPRTGQ